MKKLSSFTLIIIIAFIAYHFWPSNALTYPPGVLVSEDPIQENITSEQSWEKDEYQIIPLAKFKVKARVLSKENYWLGRETDVSPVDLALGWGPMSDQSVLDQLEIDQSNRWFHWKAKSLPIPIAEITSHASNMHIVPADEVIEDKLNDISDGSIIEMNGYLVEIKAKDGWHWRSSLSRTDSQGGACELVWVDSLNILENRN